MKYRQTIVFNASIRLCEKISVNSKTVIKNDIWEWLE